MMVVGLTGSLGTGKTTAAKMFAGLGAKVLDADKIAHGLIQPDTKAWEQIVVLFGRNILNKNQTISRGKLGSIVFNNKRYLKKLESIIHPLVIRKITKSLERISHKRKIKVVVIDAPLLIEAGLKKKVDKLIAVKLDQKSQITRSLKKPNLSQRQILKRIALQIPLSKKITMADYVIDNNKGLKNTASQVKKIWEEIKNG
ncbi:MAG: dephospho-CoA kinase [Candidatus Omnitrophota bacterium]|nr:dephospho-CoA kinase [Candidatus Omnitrophota bacterium]